MLESDPDELDVFLERQLRVELWPDINISALTYRMILLNAGQKPMSLRHQLEVVSQPLATTLKGRFSSLMLYMEKDTERRSQPGEYQFSLLAVAFQAFLQKNPNIDLRNEVIEELSNIEVLEAYGSALNVKGRSDPTKEFIDYIGFLLKLDEELFRVYPDNRASPGLTVPSGKRLLTRDTFHLGLAAAYSWARTYKPKELDVAVKRLLKSMKSSRPSEDDPLALEVLEKVLSGFKRRDNVGEQTRSAIFRGFREYFRSEGLTAFQQCWTQEA